MDEQTRMAREEMLSSINGSETFTAGQLIEELEKLNMDTPIFVWDWSRNEHTPILGASPYDGEDEVSELNPFGLSIYDD